MFETNQQQAKNIIAGFEERYRENDLDGFIDFFYEDAVYTEHNGAAHKGGKAIREAFFEIRGQHTVIFNLEP